MPISGLLKKTHFLSGMLVFGTMTAITMKMQLVMRCTGFGNIEHTFDKPFFQSIAMFVSMALALPVNEVGMLVKKAFTKSTPETQGLLSDNKAVQADGSVKKKKSKIWVIAVPACFDLVASTMMTYGLIYISVSVFQMLRGSMVIFSTILTRIFLPGRRIKSYQMFGVAVCFVALLMVGAAGILEPQVGIAVDPIMTIVGICLVVGSQVIQAGQIVTEEFLLKDLDQPPLRVVGFEGVFGSLLMIPACLIAYAVPGSDYSNMPHNSLENTWDSFVCLASSWWLLLAVGLFCLAVFAYNCYGMLITDSFSAINRTIFEAVRTACIWGVDLIIHAIWPNSAYGEQWSTWSWLELGGFVLLVFSTLSYNAVLKLPFFTYPAPASSAPATTDPEKQEKSQQ